MRSVRLTSSYSPARSRTIAATKLTAEELDAATSLRDDSIAKKSRIARLLLALLRLALSGLDLFLETESSYACAETK